MTSKRLSMSVGRWLPGIEKARGYRREWLPKDLVAGIVLIALLVPRVWPMPSWPGCHQSMGSTPR